jgi:hypothetical protein
MTCRPVVRPEGNATGIVNTASLGGLQVILPKANSAVVPWLLSR